MEQNPFKTPKSSLRLPPNKQPGSLLKAVLFGVAIDIGGTHIFGLIVSIVYSMVLAAQGMSEADMQKAFANIGMWSPIGVLALAGGLALSLIGGFVCARIANARSYTAVGIMTSISVAYATYVGADRYDWNSLLALNLVSLLATFLGGWYCIRTLPPPSV